jgi:hypothetical protein
MLDSEIFREPSAKIEDMIRTPEKFKEKLVELAEPFLEIRSAQNKVLLVGALKENLLERRFTEKLCEDSDEEMPAEGPLYIVFTNPEKSEIKVEECSADEIWNEIRLGLIENGHNLDLFFDYLSYCDDLDIYDIMADFWDVMSDSQKQKYIEDACSIFDHPDFLLRIPEYVDNLDLETLLGYMRTWTGVVVEEVLIKVAREHWKQLNRTQKALWKKRAEECPKETRDYLLEMLQGNTDGQ